MEMHKGISVKASTNIACSTIKHLFCKLVLELSKKLKKPAQLNSYSTVRLNGCKVFCKIDNQP